MNINFATPWSAISAEATSKFPGMDQENATKNVLFSRLRDNNWLPVRYLTFSGDSSMYTLLIDVPTCSNVSEIENDVLPFTSTAA